MVRNTKVLPRAVAKDPRSETALLLITLGDGLDQPTVKSWLGQLGAAVTSLEAGRRARAVAVVGFSARFFARFSELAANNPHGVGAIPELAGEVVNVDIVVHVNYTVEALLAQFVETLWTTRPVLARLDIEHGFARANEREVFGQRDGLRNLTKNERLEHALIRLAELPEEPDWLAGGSYGTWIKIQQNVDAWNSTDAPSKEAVIGRRKLDGSRLDLSPSTDPHTEDEFTDANLPSVTSHIRKVGPRGSLHDQTLMLRRGTPYIELVDGAVREGLHFISYTSSLDDVDVVVNQWMRNPHFPVLNAGPDALLQFLTFLRSTIFVVAPLDSRFPGAGYFDPAPTRPKGHLGRVHVRKRAVDGAGNPVRAELGGIEFILVDPSTGTQIGSSALTNSAGRAVLPGARVGHQVVLRESPNQRFQPVADSIVDVTDRDVIVTVINQLLPEVPGYPG